MSPTNDVAHLLDPEWRLLLACANAESATPEIAALVAHPGMDWARVRGLAARERALGTVWRVIGSAAPTSLPDEERAIWSRIAMVTEFRSQYLEDRLGQTLRAFEREGIRSVVLKGAALALSVYRGFTEREMGDIDLLVSCARADDAFRVAREIGWRWDEAAYPGHRYRQHHHRPPLRDTRDSQARLELHTRLSPEGHPLGHTLEELAAAEALIPLRWGGGEAYMLAPSWQLVHVAVHFAWSHEFTFGAWRTFRDAGRLLLALEGREREVLALAERERVTGCLFWTLRLGGEIAGVGAGSGVRRAVEAAMLEQFGRLWGSVLARHHVQSLFRFGGMALSARWQRLMWEASVQPDLAGRDGIRPWEVMEPEEASSSAALVPRGVPWSAQVRRARVLMSYLQGVVTGSAGGRSLG